MSVEFQMPMAYLPLPDRDKANSLGSLYIGLPNGDPVNPPEQKPVFRVRQNDTSIQIAQPIAIGVGGMPMYNGSPVELEISGAYSMKVLDRFGAQIYYAPYAGKVDEELNALKSSIINLQGLFVKKINTIAELRTAAPSYTFQQFSLLGHTNPGIGGGMFYYAGTVANASSDNNGTIIVSSVDGIFYQFKRFLNDYVTPEDFGAIGVANTASATDQTEPLTNFINYLNASTTTNKRAIIDTLRYGLTAPLPNITASDVWLEGGGMGSSHDSGAVKPYTELFWMGSTSPAMTMLEVAPVSGASNSRLDGIKVKGIVFNCNNGAIGGGLSARSIRHSEIDVTILNASSIGLYTGVVGSLAEAKDFRDNKVNLVTRNLDGGGQTGIGLVMDGDAISNSCFNNMESINCVSYNAVAIKCLNVDNNLWLQVSAGKGAGGGAIYSMEFSGSDTGVIARSEQVFKFSSNLPAVVRGTPLAYPARNIKFYNLDKENGCPDPVIEPGASGWWQNDNTPMYSSSWAAYTPTITASTGAFTAVSATGRYIRVVGGVHFSISISITTNGTAAGSIRATLPIAAGPGCNAVAKGYEASAGGLAIRGVIQTNGTFMSINNDSGTYPGANGLTFVLSGFYEVAT